MYNARRTLVCSAEVPIEELFVGAGDGEGASLVMLESLQFETAAEGGRLRRNVTADGGVAPVGQSKSELRGVAAQLSGKEEEFAFSRAVSRLMEMQSSSYHLIRPRVHHGPVVV
eukprot:853678-Prorocentrum_minimum.AAC.3